MLYVGYNFDDTSWCLSHHPSSNNVKLTLIRTALSYIFFLLNVWITLHLSPACQGAWGEYLIRKEIKSAGRVWIWTHNLLPRVHISPKHAIGSCSSPEYYWSLFVIMWEGPPPGPSGCKILYEYWQIGLLKNCIPLWEWMGCQCHCTFYVKRN